MPEDKNQKIFSSRNSTVLVLFLLLTGGICLWCGMEYYAQTRLTAVLERAQSGDIEAQKEAGSIYTICVDGFRMSSRMLAREKWGAFESYGYMILCDPVEGAKWYKKAASSGDGEAEFLLGTLYLTAGEQTESNQAQMRQANGWFRRAKSHGFSKLRESSGGEPITIPHDTFVPVYFWTGLAVGTGMISLFLLFISKKLPANSAKLVRTIGFFGALVSVVPCMLVIIALAIYVLHLLQ